MQLSALCGTISGTLFCVALALSSAQTRAQAHSGWHLEKTIAIGGEGGMDYLTVDPATHRLYVPRSTHTMIIDAVSGKTLGDVPGQQRAHGVAIVPRLGRGFITDGGGSGTITIFDLKTYATLGVIKAVPDADGIIYDASSDRILVSAGDSNSLITLKPDVDPKTGKIEEQIPLGGAPEFLAADGHGKVFVNLEDKDNVAVVDLVARKVMAHWPVAPGGAPVGMSLDAKNHVLIIGCRKPQKMIVMSTVDGKVVSNLPISAGVDATKVAGQEAFASCGDGNLAIATRSTKGTYSVESVKAAIGAKTMDFDSANGKIYMPTSDYEEQKPGETGRPKAIPGTFKILVVSR